MRGKSDVKKSFRQPPRSATTRRKLLSSRQENIERRAQSTFPGYPGGLTNYNANDQISTDTYDNNGNTTASNGLGYVYDFENRVIQAGRESR